MRKKKAQHSYPAKLRPRDISGIFYSRFGHAQLSSTCARSFAALEISQENAQETAPDENRGLAQPWCDAIFIKMFAGKQLLCSSSFSFITTDSTKPTTYDLTKKATIQIGQQWGTTYYKVHSTRFLGNCPKQLSSVFA